MKRGRPSLRHKIQPIILEVLQSNIPMSVNSISKQVSIRMKRTISWNTVEKYLNELVMLDKVKSITLPKLKGKKGLTVYTIKK